MKWNEHNGKRREAWPYRGFLKMGVPPNHPFIDGFSLINHPFWGYPHLWKPPIWGFRSWPGLEDGQNHGTWAGDFFSGHWKVASCCNASGKSQLILYIIICWHIFGAVWFEDHIRTYRRNCCVTRIWATMYSCRGFPPLSFCFGQMCRSIPFQGKRAELVKNDFPFSGEKNNESKWQNHRLTEQLVNSRRILSMGTYEGLHKWGYPHLWMVYSGQSQSKMDDNKGYPPFLGNLHMGTYATCLF